MADDPFDREFLRRLRQLAKERGVEPALDRARLSDPAYIRELRSRHPLNTSERQWQLARDISEVTGLPLGVAEATNSFYCARYIDHNRAAFHEIAPSQEQRAAAYKIAKRHKVEVPRREVLLNRVAYEEWIASFRKSDVASVLDIIELLGWGSGAIERAIEKHGFERTDGNWTRSVAFIEWMMETYCHLLRDEDAVLEAKYREAEKLLRKGCDRWTVADNLGLSDAAVAEIVTIVEAERDVADLG